MHLTIKRGKEEEIMETVMEKTTVMHGTFVIERTYAATPERVFAAFADPAKKRRWFIEGRNNEAETFEMDFRVGGTERSSYRMGPNSPFPGTAISNETKYMDIVPNRRIVIAYTMSMGERRFSSSQATFELAPSEKGTDLTFTEQGAYFEGSDGVERREQGWRQLLEHLDKGIPVAA
jgi:uncharacterized protein YndB with AHSA1/START domain